MYLTGLYGLLVSFALFFFQTKNTYNKRLLGVSLFSFAVCCMMGGLTYSNDILKLPHLFRTVVPFTYLVAPTSYLYVRSTIKGETGPKKYDWIHLVPFLLVCVELTPFYLKDAAFKIKAINYYTMHREDIIYLREGFMELHFHFIFRTVLALIYIGLQRNIIKGFLSVASVKIAAQYEKLTNWLKLYTLLISVTFVMVLITTIVSLYFRVFSVIPTLIMSINLLVISVVLVAKPHILYSFDPAFAVVTKTPGKLPEGPASSDKNGRKQAIHELLQNKQKYLTKGYSLIDMATELDLSPNLLSLTINHEYQMSFTDLVNQYRIEYFLTNMDKHKLANYTFEGMAAEAGFNSRTTFYRAFIKVTGKTPTDYFKTTT
jgi:AraC-like DNA-binding protein